MDVGDLPRYRDYYLGYAYHATRQPAQIIQEHHILFNGGLFLRNDGMNGITNPST